LQGRSETKFIEAKRKPLQNEGQGPFYWFNCVFSKYVLHCVVDMKTRQLSGLEQEIMNIVWELEGCSVRGVLEKINQDKQLAYTTVATILQRLHKKGLVTRRGEGISFIYSPKLSKETYSKNLAQTFISKFFNSFGDVGLASFAESIDELPSQKKGYLLELLEEYDKAK